MGYTHYWTVSNKTAPKAWGAWGKDVRAILDACADVGIHSPSIGDDFVRFDGGHETFYVARVGVGSSFCKTARKPYDVAVAACLLRLQWRNPDVDIRSDGDIHGGDWAPARELVIDLFGGE